MGENGEMLGRMGGNGEKWREGEGIWEEWRKCGEAWGGMGRYVGRNGDKCGPGVEWEEITGKKRKGGKLGVVQIMGETGNMGEMGKRCRCHGNQRWSDRAAVARQPLSWRRGGRWRGGQWGHWDVMGGAGRRRGGRWGAMGERGAKWGGTGRENRETGGGTFGGVPCSSSIGGAGPSQGRIEGRKMGGTLCGRRPPPLSRDPEVTSPGGGVGEGEWGGLLCRRGESSGGGRGRPYGGSYRTRPKVSTEHSWTP